MKRIFYDFVITINWPFAIENPLRKLLDIWRRIDAISKQKIFYVAVWLFFRRFILHEFLTDWKKNITIYVIIRAFVPNTVSVSGCQHELSELRENHGPIDQFIMSNYRWHHIHFTAHTIDLSGKAIIQEFNVTVVLAIHVRLYENVWKQMP